MEITFMSIHNLTPTANLLFASESIEEILGFTPDQVFGKSCFEYFHPDDIPFAKDEHAQGIRLDKAAVLSYVRIMGSKGDWVKCECVFSIVYDVLVACTSIYRGDSKGLKRKADAPVIQRLFSAVPKDRRYHMLQHLSAQFYNLAPEIHDREPRAALILNRFTRTLTVMFATNAVSGLLGVSPAQLNGKSFYECIEQNCLSDAIKCLESAKANDSIAYLRFRYRNPICSADQLEQRELSSDGTPIYADDGCGDALPESDGIVESPTLRTEDTTPSTENSDVGDDSSATIFDHTPELCTMSSVSSVTSRPSSETTINDVSTSPEDFEIEAVVSCTSDGLVVVLRRARTTQPSGEAANASMPKSQKARFAAPWSTRLDGSPSTESESDSGTLSTPRTSASPPSDALMNSIKECAVFAWSLTGINGTLEKYARGSASGEAVPTTGMPVWAPDTPDSLPQETMSSTTKSDHEQTNEPQKEGHGQPHAHDYQEYLLRRQNGYDDGLMGSDQAGSSARQYLGDWFNSDTLFSHKPEDYGRRDSQPDSISETTATIRGTLSTLPDDCGKSAISERRLDGRSDKRYSPRNPAGVECGKGCKSESCTQTCGSLEDARPEKRRRRVVE